MVNLAFLAPSMRAAIDFNAGGGSIAPGGDIEIPITVSGTAGQNWISAQFQLVWDTDVLALTSYQLQDLLPGSTFNPASGIFLWFDLGGLGVNVADQSALLSVTFTAANDAPLSPPTYSISFSPNPEVGLLDESSLVPATVAGTVTVVPEPVNAALCILALIFLGSQTVRRFLRTKLVAG